MRRLKRHVVVVVPLLVVLMVSVLSDAHQVVWPDRNEGTPARGGEDRAPAGERVFRLSGTSLPESDGAEWMRRDGDPFSSSAELHRLGVDVLLMRQLISEVSVDSTALAWAALVQTGNVTNGFMGESGAEGGVALPGVEGASGIGVAQQGNGRPTVGRGGAEGGSGAGVVQQGNGQPVVGLGGAAGASGGGGGSGSQPASAAGPVTLAPGGVVTPAPAPDPVPEPGTLLLLGPVLAGLAILARRRRSTGSPGGP
jgi:hypothetical protein